MVSKRESTLNALTNSNNGLSAGLGYSAKKEVWERTQKISRLQQHFKLVFKSVLNRVFTFIAL